MKIIKTIAIVIMMTAICAGCDGKAAGTGNDSNAKEVIAIQAGKTQISLEEARYYAYKSQATYEVYYLANEEELNWDKEMETGVTLEEAVKTQVLDGICKRAALLENAQKYDITLDETEKSEIAGMVTEYFADTDEKLLKKIDISEEKLTEAFENKKIAEKVQNAMEAEKSGSSDEMYEEWKKKNKVKAGKNWEEINYKESIFDEE